MKFLDIFKPKATADANKGETENKKQPDIFDPIMPQMLTISRNLDVTYTPEFYHDPANIISILSSNTFYAKYFLYSNMETFWTKVLCNINYLKNMVSSQHFTLKIDEEDNVDAQQKLEVIQQAEENMVGSPFENINTFKQMLEDIVSAYGYGLSVQELLYERKDGLVLPKGSLIYSGMLYEYSMPEGRVYPKYIDDRQWAENKYILTTYRSRSTPNLSALGVYQSIGVLYAYQTLAKQYLNQLSEKFGQPLLKGVYPKNSSQDFVSAFANWCKNFGANSYIVGPEGVDLELIASSINASNNPQQALLDYCDKMADIAMLGQSSTTNLPDQGGSRAAVQVHERKENDVVANLTSLVLDNLNHQFIPNILRINGMTLDNAPQYTMENIPNFDLLKNKIEIIQSIQALGFVVDTEQFIQELDDYGIKVQQQSLGLNELATDNSKQIAEGLDGQIQEEKVKEIASGLDEGLSKGIKQESSEHSNLPQETVETIAKDHLKEDKNYYNNKQ